MGLNYCLLAYADDDELDLGQPAANAVRCQHMIKALFPRTSYDEVGTTALDEGAFPARGRVNVGAFRSGVLVATRDAALFNPTKLAPRYLKARLGRTVVLITQHSAYDMFAYARWVDGQLIRSISVNPVGKVWESLGDQEPFELAFWKGLHPVDADYPLPFHPLEMSGAAVRSVLRVHFERPPAPGLIDPSSVVLRSFQHGHG